MALPALSQAPAEVARPATPPPLVAIAPPAEPNAFPLYPDGAPRIEGAAPAETWNSILGHTLARNVTQPTLTPFLPDPAKATGAAVIVAPGGGFVSLAMDIEGWDVARWLADHGVAAFVLKYRVTPSPADPVALRQWEAARNAAPRTRDPLDRTFAPAIEDGLAAMRLVRGRASQFGVDPARVGMVGFSAGAMTTLKVALADQVDARPAFIGVIYGPMNAVQAPANPPPLFTAIAANDPLFGDSDFGILKSWRAAGSQAELHVYQTGDHGFGMIKNGTTTELWPEEFMAWLKLNRIVR
jgi:acetyl esterase/lipase